MTINQAATVGPTKFLLRNRFHKLHNKHQIEIKQAKSPWFHKEQQKAQLQVKVKNQKSSLGGIPTMGPTLVFLKIRG